MWIKFERSVATDRLKPEHTIPIGDESFILHWMYDDRSIESLCTLPALLPPAHQQPPQNTLDVLNDDCLREIFLQLTEFDRCEVALVCQRFAVVVMSAIPKHFKITNLNCTPLWKVERYCRIFGAKIRMVDMSTYGKAAILLVFLSKYCKNLIELSGTICCKNAMDELVALLPRLRRLNLLHKGSCDLVFQANAQIESIRVETVDHLPSIHLPNLRDLEIDVSVTQPPSIPNFFALNQQIERLVLCNMLHQSISILLNSLPDLKVFQASGVRLSSEDAAAFGQMKRLQSLHLFAAGKMGHISEMLRALVENDVRLKRLSLVTKLPLCHLDIGYIIRMKYLEYLKVHRLNDVELVRLLDNCRSLKEIKIKSSVITLRGIREALKLAKCMKKARFAIFVDRDHSQMIVNQSEEIDAIAELRTYQAIDVIIKLNVKADTNCKYEVSLRIYQHIEFEPIESIFLISFSLFFIADYNGDIESSQRLDSITCFETRPLI